MGCLLVSSYKTSIVEGIYLNVIIFMQYCREESCLLTCLQWFSNTMRQVSGSAVQGLEGAALRPARLPGPRGFSLLNQLILDPGGGEGFKDTRTAREGVSRGEKIGRGGGL